MAGVLLRFIFTLTPFLLLSNQLLAEGTKEIMPVEANDSRILLSTQNSRDPFAIYNADSNYRLYINIKDYTKEVFYFGLGQIRRSNNQTASPVTYRIHMPDGTIIFEKQTPQTGETGFINNYAEAIAGPDYLDPSGYDADSLYLYTVGVNGDYYMTFQLPNNTYRTFEYFDITVIDTSTNTKIDGRVFSRNWQISTFEEGSVGYLGYMYVYSQDSIVTRFNPNGFDGRHFSFSCNPSGLYPIGPSWPATEARKSREYRKNYPLYRVFLNDPDSIVYPSGALGSLVQNTPVVQTIGYCNVGTIDFIFEVTATGSGELMLNCSELGAPYVDRLLSQTVYQGWDTITWDGFDGSVPPNQIPNGSQFNFSLTYINGITHLPLWDVENNEFGFLVELTRPSSTVEPAFHWDDTELSPSMPPGPTTSPPGGCLSSISPCHLWFPGAPGDNRTVNTWWYVANVSTTQVLITYKVSPSDLGTITGPDEICQGAQAIFFVIEDPQSDEYRWTYPGGVDTTLIPTLSVTIPAGATPGPAQITVHGINAECGDGPVSTKNITINEIPDVTTSPLDTSICNNTSPSVTLTSNVTGATYAWRAYSINPAIGGYFNSSGPTISQTLTNSGTSIDTAYYRVAATASGCLGDTVTYKIAVYPIPDLSNSPASQTQCNNLNTLLELTSNVTGTLFTWTCTPSSGNISGYSDNSTPTDSINQTLVNTGYNIETVTYNVIPIANGCDGPVASYIVTIYPTPDLSNNPPLTEICNGENTGITLTSNVSGTSFTWTCTQTSGNISGYSPNAGPGSTSIDQTLALTGFVQDTVLYHLTPDVAGCPGEDTTYVVVVYPIPALSVSPMSDSICSEETTNVNLTATVLGTGYSWTAAQGVGNINGFSNGSGSLIAQQLFNPDVVPGSVLYTITPATTSCTGEDTTFTMWVKPLPHLTNLPKGDSICNNTGPNITLISDVTNTWFTWTATGSSILVSGYSAQATPTTLLDQTLMNSGFDLEWATYQVAPTAAGCDGPDSNYVVTVYPVPDLSNNPPDTAICNGQPTGVILNSNVSSTLFTWTATGSSILVSGYSDQTTPTDTLDQILFNTGYDIETVTYTLTPNANGCDGIDTSFVVTVYPVPDVSNTPMLKEICNNNNTDIDLTSNVSGTLFTWTATGSSVNITGYFDNTTPATHIGDNLINLGDVNETVTYHITPHANGCDGVIVDYVVTIVPSPYLTNNPLKQNQCNNLNTNLTLESNVIGTLFTWTCTPSSGNISGYSNSTTPGTLIDQTLINSGFDTDSVIYHVTPENSGCPGSVTDYTVVVYPVPDVFFVPNGETVCEGVTSNIQNQSHVSGATFSWIATASSPNLSGYSADSGDLIAQTIDNSGFTIETVTYSVTPEANGCPPGTTQPVILTVNPRPVVTNAVTSFSQCNNATTAILLQADVTGSTFAWRAFASSANLSGFSNGAGATITQTLVNNGYDIDSVTYRVAATANSCPGDSTDFIVVVFPVADVIFTPPSQSLCSGETTGLAITSNVDSTSFTWTASGSSPDVSGYASGSGNLIQQTLFNAGYLIPTVTYTVTPVANGCTGTSNNVVVEVYPLPVVSMTICFDTLMTSEYRPFELKGANPPGGVYSGTGVSNGQFFPAIADTGRHTITYYYANTYGCDGLDSLHITVVNPVSHNCGDTVNDIRDNQTYPTVDINGQCWMAANLNFGNVIASAQMQRDNCVNEKYCINDNPANCNSYGGLYHWNEIMRYTETNGAQGFCPAGWHIPTETDWTILFNFYISSGFAGSALKASGYSGFNALLEGIRFHNTVWRFRTTDVVLNSTIYWSSTKHGPDKAWSHGINEVVFETDYTPSVSFYPSQWTNTFLVRCIRD